MGWFSNFKLPGHKFGRDTEMCARWWCGFRKLGPQKEEEFVADLRAGRANLILTEMLTEIMKRITELEAKP